jgi:toxin YoeB
MRSIVFHADAFADFTAWAQQDAGAFDKIRRLIIETLREPFIGIGKPEPLKHEFKGCWSRRITGEHRLVYRVTADAIIIVACRYHY